MRFSPEEKADTIELVLSSPDGITRTLKALGIHKRTFYNWYNAYSEGGTDALRPRKRTRAQWNQIPEPIKALVVTVSLENENTMLSPRELAVKITDEMNIFISKSWDGDGTIFLPLLTISPATSFTGNSVNL